jgi:hypothetical protein
MNVHPARITAALDAAELWGPQVDIHLGGREPMVDEWEAGTRTPTDDQVRALAELTGVPLDWFLEPGAPKLVGMACMRGPRRAMRVYETPPRTTNGLLA